MGPSPTSSPAVAAVRVGGSPAPPTVVVTGASGFIGSRLVASLAADGIPVVGIDIGNDHLYDPRLKRAAAAGLAQRWGVEIHPVDIGDTAAVAGILAGSGADVVVHLAALAGVRPSVERPEIYHRTNVAGTASLLQAMDDAGVGRLVFASSSSVYGANPDVPWSETARLDPQSPYAETKRLGELLIADWASAGRAGDRTAGRGVTGAVDGGRRAVVTRLFTVYGPGQRPDQAVTRFAVRMLTSRPIEVYGDGSARRDLTHVDDVVTGLRAAMEPRSEPLLVCNLARGAPVGLLELVTTLEEVLGVEAKVDFTAAVAGDVAQTWGSIERAALALSWRPTIGLRAGLASASPWFERLAAAAG